MQGHDGLYPRQDAKDELELQLARWLNNRRCEYATGHLQLERQAALESPHVFDETWLARYAALQRWLQQHSWEYPRQHQLAPEERALGEWLNHQRAAYQSQQLTAPRAALLASLPGWSWQPQEDAWNDWFALAEAWFFGLPWSRSNPRPQYPRSTGGSVQRDLIMSESAAPGSAPASAREVVTGSSRVRISVASGNLTESEVQLARWMLRQRSAFLRGRFSVERFDKLSTLPEWLWPLQPGVQESDASWEHSFARLLAWTSHRFNIRHEVLQLGPEPCSLPLRWRGASLYERHLALWFVHNLGQLRNAESLGSSAPGGCISHLGDEGRLPPLPDHRLLPFLRFFRETLSYHVRFVRPDMQAVLLAVDSQLIAEGAHKRPFSTVGCRGCVPELHDNRHCCFPRHHGANPHYSPQFVWADGGWTCAGPKFAFTTWVRSCPTTTVAVASAMKIPVQTISAGGGDDAARGPDASLSASSSSAVHAPAPSAPQTGSLYARWSMDADDF